MNKKILGILIMTLLIGTAVLPLANSFEENFYYNFMNDEYYNDCKCMSYIESIGGRIYVMSNPLIAPSNIEDYVISSSKVDLPEYFNWMDHNGSDWTTPAKNQGNCGSCWDFAALGSLESIIEIRENCSGLNPDLSEQYVLSCLPYSAHDPGNGCSSGGTPYKAFFWIKDDSPDGNGCNGIIAESCFVYQASDDIPCSDKCENWEQKLVPIVDCEESWPGFDSVSARDIIKLKIYENGPVAAGMDANQDFINWGAFHHNPDDYFAYRDVPWRDYLNHLILIIGWKDDYSIGNGGYWICKNSWGADWGYEGFYNIEYGCLFTGMYISWVDYDPSSFDWPPVADAGGIYECKVDEFIEFDGSKSVDAEGDISNYTWDFGDGEMDYGISPTHSYDVKGVYTVTLTVMDGSNQSDSAETIVGVGNDPFDIEFSGGLGLTLSIKNNAEEKIRDLKWDLQLDGFLLSLSPVSGTISDINANEVFELFFILIGIGRASIRLYFEEIIEEKDLFLIGPFIFILNKN